LAIRWNGRMGRAVSETGDLEREDKLKPLTVPLTYDDDDNDDYDVFSSSQRISNIMDTKGGGQ